MNNNAEGVCDFAKRKYDVFITYRRDDGLNYAQLLFQALEKRGYRCFLDVRDEQDGEYEKRIMVALRNAPNYILIMTEGSLRRLSEIGNSVWNEVHEALCLHKKVIPVAPSGVSRSLYGAKLLKEFDCLRELSVSRLETGEFFEESINNIVKRFPVRTSRFIRRILKWLLVAALIVVIGVAVVKYVNDNPIEDLDNKDSVSNNTDISVEPILKRMKEMRLPTISFKPPATIVDAVEFLRQASRDYDRPDIPFDMRGFNIKLKMKGDTAQGLGADEGFGADADDAVIPQITATDISFYDALNLVCECVEYRFEIANGTIVVLPKDMALVELPTQWLDVDDDRLHETVSAWAVYDKERNDGFGFEKKDEDQESSFCSDVKGFLGDHDVKWPPGSRLRYLSSTSQLRITNSLEEIERIRALLRKNKILIEAQQR